MIELATLDKFGSDLDENGNLIKKSGLDPELEQRKRLIDSIRHDYAAFREEAYDQHSMKVGGLANKSRSLERLSNTIHQQSGEFMDLATGAYGETHLCAKVLEEMMAVPRTQRFAFSLIEKYQDKLGTLGSPDLDYHRLKWAHYLVQKGNESQKQLGVEILKQNDENMANAIDYSLQARERGLYLADFYETAVKNGGEELASKIINVFYKNIFQDKTEGSFSEAMKFFKQISTMQNREAIPREVRIHFIKMIIYGYGLDVESTFDAWLEGSGADADKNYTGMIPGIGNIESHCYRLNAIENARPGISKYLIENYGIRCFGRYPLDMLIDQYDEDCPAPGDEEKAALERAKPHGVVIYPYSDWNGGYNDDIDTLREFYYEIKRLGYKTRLAECKTTIDIARQFLKFRRDFDEDDSVAKVAFGIIAGHGSESLMDFGGAYREDDPLKKYSGITTEKAGGRGLQRLGEFFEYMAPIVFSSCEVGKRGGLVQSISESVVNGDSLNMIASKKVGSFYEIHPYKQNGILKFRALHTHRGSARSYIGGKEQPRKKRWLFI